MCVFAVLCLTSVVVVVVVVVSRVPCTSVPAGRVDTRCLLLSLTPSSLLRSLLLLSLIFLLLLLPRRATPLCVLIGGR